MSGHVLMWEINLLGSFSRKPKAIPNNINLISVSVSFFLKVLGHESMQMLLATQVWLIALFNSLIMSSVPPAIFPFSKRCPCGLPKQQRWHLVSLHKHQAIEHHDGHKEYPTFGWNAVLKRGVILIYREQSGIQPWAADTVFNIFWKRQTVHFKHKYMLKVPHLWVHWHTDLRVSAFNYSLSIPTNIMKPSRSEKRLKQATNGKWQTQIQFTPLVIS